MRFLLVGLFFSFTTLVSAQQKVKNTDEQDLLINDTEAYAAPFDSSIFYTDTIIRWYSFEEAVAAQKTKPKKIYIDIYATWCRWCRQTDSLVFKNREIAHYINQHYYPVKFNAEYRNPVQFRGREFTFIKDEDVFAHALAEYLLNGKLSYPGTVFLDEEGNTINVRNGYMEADYFEVVLNYYASNAYKKFSFYDFEFEFDGKVHLRH